MIPNITRGSSPGRLLAYLFGRGRHNEHADQHAVAVCESLARRFDGQGLPVESLREIGRAFDETWKRLAGRGRGWKDTCPPDMRGRRNPERAAGKERVWHCSLSIKAGDGILRDDQWAQIVRDYLTGMGVIDDDGMDAAPWVAVRHGLSRNGNDHVHIMVSLAGYRDWLNPWHDRINAQKVCRQIEREHPELRLLADDRSRQSASWQWSQWRRWAEWKARDDYGDGWEELSADEREARVNAVGADTLPLRRIARLVEACAVSSRTEDEFIRRVRRCGLNIDPRLRKGTRRDTFDDVSQVTGYTVTWRSGDEWRMRVSARQLGPELTLRGLRKQWRQRPDDRRVAVAEWRSAMENRRPALMEGREKESLNAMEMNQLVDRAFRIAIDLQSAGQAGGDAYDSALRDGLRRFERLSQDYGLGRYDSWDHGVMPVQGPESDRAVTR